MDAATRTFRIALAQIDPVVGDIAGNADLIRDAVDDAAAAGARLVVLPEQAICGYPAEDLLLKRQFLRSCRDAVDALARDVQIPVLVGLPEHDVDTFNSCAVLAGGEVAATYRKQHLPNYGVFDEHRWFQRGQRGLVLDLGDVLVGVTVCEDLWVPGGPAVDEAAAGAQVIVNLSASPYRMGRGRDRERLLAARATESCTAVVLCNMVGGQDELVFDGSSLAVDHEGRVIARGLHCAPDLVFVDIDVPAIDAARLREGLVRSVAEGVSHAPVDRVVVRAPAIEPSAGDIPGNLVRLAVGAEQEVWDALMLGLRDYVSKNGFKRVLVGLSGGIDSALVLLLAADALGVDHVRAVTMPSQVTSSATLDDARAMATLVGVELTEIAIEPVMQSYLASLAASFAGTQPGIAEENLQARIRGNLLMAISNKHGDLVLTTGNKSETAVGYTTLYGDAAGGLAPIRDVPKTLVYRLARWRNACATAAGDVAPIPPSIIDRPPTAELHAGQLDTDSLPPYDELDRMLEALVEEDRSALELVADGHDPARVEQVMRLLDRAEYKRRQAPPGIRVTSRAFGRERRMPITNRYVEDVASTDATRPVRTDS